MTRTRRLGALVTSLALMTGAGLAIATPAHAAPPADFAVEGVPADPIVGQYGEPFDVTHTWKVTGGTATAFIREQFDAPTTNVRSGMSGSFTVTSADGTVRTVPVTCSYYGRYFYYNYSCLSTEAIVLTEGDVITRTESLTFEYGTSKQTYALVGALHVGNTGDETWELSPAATSTVHVVMDTLPVPVVEPLVAGATLLVIGLLGAGVIIVLRRRRSPAEG